MRVNGRPTLGEVTIDDIVAEAQRWRLDSARAEAAAVSTLQELRTSVSEDESLPDQLSAYVSRRCNALLG